MQSLSEVTYLDFKNALDKASVRVMQIIFIALAMGVGFFSVIVLVMYLNRNEIVYNQEMIQVINIMSVINLFSIVTSILVSKFIYERQFSDVNLRGAVTREFKDKEGRLVELSPAKKCIAIIRTAYLISLALMEGSAFFGLSITIIVIQSGVGNIEPIYYLNGLSIFPLFIYIIQNFPTEEKIEEIFKTKIQKLI